MVRRGNWNRRLTELRATRWWGEAFGEKMTAIYQDALAGKTGFGDFNETELLYRIFGAEYVNDWLTELEDEDEENRKAEEEEGRG